eukprot:322067-Amorphochlora_amoeboformis.AAC.2
MRLIFGRNTAVTARFGPSIAHKTATIAARGIIAAQKPSGCSSTEGQVDDVNWVNLRRNH